MPEAARKFIIVYKDSATQEQIDEHIKLLEAQHGRVTNKYDAVMKGFAGYIPDSFMGELQSFQNEGIIDYMEPDGVASIQVG